MFFKSNFFEFFIIVFVVFIIPKAFINTQIQLSYRFVFLYLLFVISKGITKKITLIYGKGLHSEIFHMKPSYKLKKYMARLCKWQGLESLTSNPPSSLSLLTYEFYFAKPLFLHKNISRTNCFNNTVINNTIRDL